MAENVSLLASHIINRSPISVVPNQGTGASPWSNCYRAAEEMSRPDSGVQKSAPHLPDTPCQSHTGHTGRLPYDGTSPICRIVSYFMERHESQVCFFSVFLWTDCSEANNRRRDVPSGSVTPPDVNRSIIGWNRTFLGDIHTDTSRTASQEEQSCHGLDSRPLMA